MPIYQDEAIVLRQYPIADSDSVVVSVGQDLGKIRAVAKGIKKTKSQLSACLQPLNHVRIEFYSREGRELGNIRYAELLHSYAGKLDSLSHLFALTYFSDLVHGIAQDNQSNPLQFRLLLASLKAGEKKVPVTPLIRYFEVWCLKINGFYPNYAYCSNCGKYVKEEGFFARIQDGLARCTQCASERDIYIGTAASMALQEMMNRSPEEFAALPMDDATSEQIERMTQELLSMHVDIALKSYKILKEMLNG
jgi:DNA repair protein RecO (recombination protein O)